MNVWNWFYSRSFVNWTGLVELIESIAIHCDPDAFCSSQVPEKWTDKLASPSPRDFKRADGWMDGWMDGPLCRSVYDPWIVGRGRGDTKIQWDH